MNVVGEVIIINIRVDINTGYITRSPIVSQATCFLLTRNKIKMCITIAHILDNQTTQLFYLNFKNTSLHYNFSTVILHSNYNKLKIKDLVKIIFQ